MRAQLNVLLGFHQLEFSLNSDLFDVVLLRYTTGGFGGGGGVFKLLSVLLRAKFKLCEEIVSKWKCDVCKLGNVPVALRDSLSDGLSLISSSSRIPGSLQRRPGSELTVGLADKARAETLQALVIEARDCPRRRVFCF